MMSKVGFLSMIMLVVSVDKTLGQVGLPCHSSIFQMTPRHNINIPTFMGDWYAHEFASSNIGNTPQPQFRCLRDSYHLPNSSDISRIVVIESWVNITSGQFQQDLSNISVNNTRSPFTAMWTASKEGIEYTTDTVVFQSDLEHRDWAVVYSCAIRQPDNFRVENVFAITRNRAITSERRDFLKAMMVGYGFRIGDHRTISQEDC